MKYLGPFLVGTTVTVAAFFVAAVTLPTPKQAKTAAQIEAEAVMLTPQPLMPTSAKPTPATLPAPARTVAFVDPVATVPQVAQRSAVEPAATPVEPAAEVAGPQTADIEPIAAVAPPAEVAAVPIPKPAERTQAEEPTLLALAEETPAPAEAAPDAEGIEERLAAAGDLWDQQPASSLAELVERADGDAVPAATPEADPLTVAALPEPVPPAAEPIVAEPVPTPEPSTALAVDTPAPGPEPVAVAPEPVAIAPEPVAIAPEPVVAPAPPPVETAAVAPAPTMAPASASEGSFAAGAMPAAGSISGAKQVPTKVSGGNSMVLTRVVVLDAGGFRAVRENQGLIVRISGVEPLPFDRVCKNEATGASWRCGAKARAAFAQYLAGRMVDCEEVSVVKPKPVREIQARCALDGEDVATWLVSQGWADASGTDDRLAAAAKTAQQNGRGQHGAAGG
ncbi:thermonuclease family protein [Chthonobacter albigriseus]|uniref:thermonuclease family protein n=1 Tax=Chthonobacter albigriseus TaxID=1683161 RepID=UPI0015EEB4A9|nr:thermonuclease family protein [Chthonobacter albigriseus]